MKTDGFLFVLLLLIGIAGGCMYENYSPEVVIKVDIKGDDRTSFIEEVTKFGRAEKLFVEDLAKDIPPKEGRQYAYIKLTGRDGLEIVITDFTVENNFSIAIYAKEDGAPWKQVSDKLIGKLKDNWPGSVNVVPAEERG